MSNKYVPSFLKNQSANGGAGTSVNRFAAFDDDFKAPVAAATLASLTANSDSKSSGKSYAARFSEKSRTDDRRGPSRLVTKKMDVGSEEQFPTLGGAVKKPAGAWGKPVTVTTATTDATATVVDTKFADLAKVWAKQKEDEDVAVELKRIEDEKRYLEEKMLAATLKSRIKSAKFDGLENPDQTSEEDYFNNPYISHDALADEDSVELPSEEEPFDEDGEFGDDDIDENGEYNPNIVNDGRRKNDLY